jgi:hypothetical protein
VAFISDIHGNLQAPKAVLADIEAQGVREIICLGDIVGYGANPSECVGLIRAADMPCLRGNHDAYAGDTTPLPDRPGVGIHAAYAGTRSQLGNEACDWLGILPFAHSSTDFEAVRTSLHHLERWGYADYAEGRHAFPPSDEAGLVCRAHSAAGHLD